MKHKAIIVFIILFIVYNVKTAIVTTPAYYKFLYLNGNMSYITTPTVDTKPPVPKSHPRRYKTVVPVLIKREHFQPIVIDKTCLLLPDIGPCRAKISMYFFDPNIKNCSVFKWGGCQGNGNRYDRLRDCLGTCLSSQGYRPRRPRYCQLTFDYGWCFGAEERWYYDFRYKVCKKTIYSGCGGNKNNFYNREQCDSVCRFGSTGLNKKPRPTNEPLKIVVVNPENDKKTKKKLLKVGNKADDESELARKVFGDVTLGPPLRVVSEHMIINAKDQNLHDDRDLHADDDRSLELPQILG